jgi:hypothetical protein
MNQEKKHNETLQEIEETVAEAQVSHHILSSPTVSKKHNWRQMGNQIICDSCESSHGFRIKTGFQMCGIDPSGFPTITQIY